MKNAAIVIVTSIMLLTIVSCEDMMGDFLEKAPGVDVTEDTIFSSRSQVEMFLASIYEYGVHSNLGLGSPDNGAPAIANSAGTIDAGATDEAEACANWYDPQKWNNASVSPDNTDDPRFSHRFTAIRKVTVMLDRVDEVPDITKEYANQLKAESKFIRALNYFEMFKRYGGVPIIDHRLQLDENLKIPRSSVEDVVNFIVKDCDEAIPDLAVNQLGALRGRATRGAALALKARTLLYAASDLFNTDKPYLDFGTNNKLICYGNKDKERWKLAADAAKKVLDWAKEANCYLITDQGLDGNYKYSWQTYDNSEIIFAEKSSDAMGKYTWPWSAISPPTVYPGNAGQSGVTVTLNLVSKYEDRLGNKVDWNGGNDLQAKMASLDYRFSQTVVGNLMRWNSEFPKLQLWQDSGNGPGADVNTCYGGFWLHKLYPEEISESVWRKVPNSTLYQLNEAYLNYAEALNEYNEGPTQEAYDAINTIRKRSGQPDLPTGLGYLEFRAKVRNERAIELAFDGHRFYDIRRWMIAEEEGVMQGGMLGIKIYQIPESTEYRYEPYVFETRSFSRRMYLHPFGTGEINKGYLIQNPGY